jgi:hypothetical protein
MDFNQSWEASFPNCPPVSYEFKWKMEDRWIRMHSLPDSKQYAENDEELDELLRRQNTLLLDVVGRGEECFIVAGDWSESPKRLPDFSTCPKLKGLIDTPLPSIDKQEFDPEEEDDDYTPIFLNLGYGKQKVTEGFIDEVLLCVAEDVVRFFVVNFQRSRIFAPYDGGVDLVLRDSAERDTFKLKYSKWLPSHPSGY